MKVLISIVLCLFVIGGKNKQSIKTNIGNSTGPKPRKVTASEASITVIESGKGLEHTIQIEAAERFRLFFEAKKNYGITRWYDLAGDPTASIDLLHNPTDYIPIHAQGAIFNPVSYTHLTLPTKA